MLGTAGHVDHGKTSLVHALTGVQTDRLPEEQRRGITIELGFAPWKLDDDWLVSVIDAPGHRRLVHNMIAGASGIDVVLLVIAADEGVMPQTREHIAACKLLGVERAVVAVTKCDKADVELAELAGEEARDLLLRHDILASVVRCSSKTREGLDELRVAVVDAVKASRRRREQKRARLGVDRAFSVHGAGTVVTGTLVEGSLAVGAAVRVLGGKRDLDASVRGLHIHGEARTRVEAPTRLAVNLGGVSLEEVARGMVVTDDPGLTATRTLDVWLEPLEPLRRGSTATVFIGTSRTVARIQPIDESLGDDGGPARLRLSEPLVTRGGDRFVLRGANVDGPAGAVCGGGTVLDAHPPTTVRAQKRRGLLEALHAGEASRAVQSLAEESAPRAIHRARMTGRFAIDGATLSDAASSLAKKELKSVGDGVWALRASLEELKEAALARVREHHEALPLQPGMELQTLRAELIRLADPHVGAAALGELTSGATPKLVIEGPTVRVRDFKGASSGSAAAATLERVRELAASAKLSGVAETELVATGLDPKLCRASLASLERTGALIHSGRMWFDAPSIEDLITRIRLHFGSHELLTIAEVKAMTGLARKQTIPLLEHLDRQRVTLRASNGSDRLRGPKG